MRCGGVQIAGRFPYAEIHDNLVGADLLPLNLLRCKLAFFGATKFDPKSDRWLRINMFQGAPFPDEFYEQPPDDWAFPPLGQRVGGGGGVICSLNEIQSAVLKATRGAGLSWGVAEEASRAARWLEARELPGVEGLAALLARIDANRKVNPVPNTDGDVWRGPGGWVSSLHAGIALADLAGEIEDDGALVIHDVAEPLIFLPFAALASQVCQTPLAVSWPRCEKILSGGEIVGAVPVPETGSTTRRNSRCASSVRRRSPLRRNPRPGASRSTPPSGPGSKNSPNAPTSRRARNPGRAAPARAPWSTRTERGEFHP